MPLYVSPMDSMYRRYSIIEIGNVEPCVVITTHTMPCDVRTCVHAQMGKYAACM